MIHRKIVVLSFLAMFGAETMDTVPADLLLEELVTDDEHLQQLGKEKTTGESKMITCGSWSEIKKKVYEHIDCHQGEQVIVGLDVDETLIDLGGLIDGKEVSEFLTTLKGRRVPFFALTAYYGYFWPLRRKHFDDAGLTDFFRKSESESESESDVPFLRVWEESRDDNKRYYWDSGYSTMYTNRMRPGKGFSEKNPSSPESKECPEDFYWQRDTLLLRTSKGVVLRSAIEDGIITRPGVMVFIDDGAFNVKDVCLVCKRLGINCLGIIFSAWALPEPE
jgi:hypothetical protein